MTITDFLYYLLFGVVLGVCSTLHNARPKRGRRDGAPGLHLGNAADAALHTICALERAAGPEKLLQRLARRYEQIVAGFAEGDLTNVADQLSADVRLALTQAIAARSDAERNQGNAFVRVRSTRIVEAALGDGAATLSIAFVGLMGSAAGEAGFHEATDVWTFERSTSRRRPQWLLVGTEPIG